MPKKEKTYKQAIFEIEDILQKIDTEELDLDELTENLQNLSNLVKQVKQKLRKTEEEVGDILKELEE